MWEAPTEYFSGDEIVTRVLLWVKTEDGCVNFSSCEAGDRQFKLIGGLQTLKEGFVRCGFRTGGGGVRLKDRG
jgi:hypothetical protein